MNLITRYNPLLFPPKKFSKNKIFTYNLRTYLINKNGRTVLFKGNLDDITKNGDYFVVHFTSPLFSEDYHFLNEGRIKFHLKCKYEAVKKLIEKPPKQDPIESLFFSFLFSEKGFFVACKIGSVKKIVNYTVRGYSAKGSEDVKLEVESPDVFSASGELIEMAKYYREDLAASRLQ